MFEQGRTGHREGWENSWAILGLTGHFGSQSGTCKQINSNCIVRIPGPHFMTQQAPVL